MGFILRWLIWGAVAALPFSAQADPQGLPHSPLEESLPLTFEPIPLSIEDYQVTWTSPSLPGVQVRLGKESLEWVRVDTIYIQPRASLIIEASQFESGQILYAGIARPLASRVEMPISLVGENAHPIDIELLRGGKLLKGRLKAQFRSRPQLTQRIGVDHTCSSFKVEITAQPALTHSWVSAACKVLYTESEEHYRAHLLISILWQGHESTVAMDGMSIPPHAPEIYNIQLGAERPSVKLTAGSETLHVQAHIPKHPHLGAFGAGIGPYLYHYDGGSLKADGVTTLATLYASMHLDDKNRFAVFHASPLHETIWGDTGFYLITEQIRDVDQRLSVNFLLGGQIQNFRRGSTHYLRLSGPQGIEITFKDLFKKGTLATTGMFFYPFVGGASYYDVWVRWGQPSLFAEVNWISWRQTIQDKMVTASAFGLSIGTTLARFF